MALGNRFISVTASFCIFSSFLICVLLISHHDDDDDDNDDDDGDDNKKDGDDDDDFDCDPLIIPGKLLAS